MLLEFRIKGFRSILNEVTLSLMAGNGTDVLPLSLVYGANGSDKSSVLSAFADLKGRALGRAMRFEPHRLSDGVITYLVYFRRNGKNYGYKLSFSKEIYLSEELFKINQSKCRKYCRYYLCLVSYLVYCKISEIPYGNVSRCSACNTVGIQKLT